MWTNLQSHEERVRTREFRTLFDANRVADFSVSADDLFFDYSKTNIDAAIKSDLIALANAAGWAKARDAMMSGEKINVTEDRAVLHTALRAPAGPILVDGVDVMPDVLETRKRMFDFVSEIRSGAIQGAGGAYTDVVNIGIGGSDLGPAMAVLAMAPYADGPACHFVSNIDAAHVSDVLKDLNPATTLVIVASKTFTTIETMTNAKTALDWMAQSVDRPADQFVALSTNMEKTASFGIDDSRVFGFEDWVGGRYSLWGPIGLSIALAVGPEDFQAFLDGGAAMDHHFVTAPAGDNLPVMLALVGMWHRQVCGYATRAVLPYEQRLSRFPAYLQQLEMESNGKRVTLAGDAPEVSTGPVVWGEPGTNGQHAFYQLIHQGTEVVPCEFMVAREGHEPDLVHHHRLLQANCLAQSEALMLGRDLETAKAIAADAGYTGDELNRQAAHRVFPGNRPSTTLCYPKLTPFVLGQLIALYEHRVFVEAVILGINSFDQWGVELGKILATDLLPLIEGNGDRSAKDGSTQALLDYLT